MSNRVHITVYCKHPEAALTLPCAVPAEAQCPAVGICLTVEASISHQGGFEQEALTSYQFRLHSTRYLDSCLIFKPLKSLTEYPLAG